MMQQRIDKSMLLGMNIATHVPWVAAQDRMQRTESLSLSFMLLPNKRDMLKRALISNKGTPSQAKPDERKNK